MIKLFVHVWQKAVCVNQSKVKKQTPTQIDVALDGEN